MAAASAVCQRSAAAGTSTLAVRRVGAARTPVLPRALASGRGGSATVERFEGATLTMNIATTEEAWAEELAFLGGMERLDAVQHELLNAITTLDTLLVPQAPQLVPAPQAESRGTGQAQSLAPTPQTQQQMEAGAALPAPLTAVSARRANQARASRNSAGRTAASPAPSPARRGQRTRAMDAQVQGDGTAQFFKHTSSVGLLQPEEQQEVAAVVKDYLSLKSIEKGLIGILKRPPTVVEWAKAVKMDPSSFQARLRRGQEAKALMLKSNYRLVVKVVKAYQNRGLSLQDLITEGMQGLVKAVGKFEADKGFRFSTYAHWWIRQAVTRAVQDQGRAVRIPIHLQEKISRILHVKSRLRTELGRAPTTAEVGRGANVPAQQVLELLAMSQPSSSLDAGCEGGADEGASSAKDQVPDERDQPDEVMETDNLAASVEAVLAQALTKRETDVLRLRLGLDGNPEQTLAEVGKRFGVTREWVRQVQARAIRKLKASHLALPSGLLGELQAATVQSDGASIARVSRGTKKS